MILQSGSVLNPWAYTSDFKRNFLTLAKNLGCEGDSSAILICLQQASKIHLGQAILLFSVRLFMVFFKLQIKFLFVLNFFIFFIFSSVIRFLII